MVRLATCRGVISRSCGSAWLGQVDNGGMLVRHALGDELQLIERGAILNCPGVLVSVLADPLPAHAAAASNDRGRQRRLAVGR